MLAPRPAGACLPGWLRQMPGVQRMCELEMRIMSLPLRDVAPGAPASSVAAVGGSTSVGGTGHDGGHREPERTATSPTSVTIQDVGAVMSSPYWIDCVHMGVVRVADGSIIDRSAAF